MKICALALCVGTFAVTASLAADPVTVEQIIAKVNGEIITVTELQRERRQMEAQMRARGMTPQQILQQMNEREKDVLRDRIDHLLLIQRGKDLNINVDQEVSKYLGQIQAENKIADPDQFQQWIREQVGMTFEDFRSETRNGILSQRVIGMEVSSKINVPRPEVEQYYQQHKDEFIRKERVFVREILVSFEGRTPEEAEKRAKDLVARARRGERFAELARDNSDAVTAREGGLLPGFDKGVLRPELEQLLWDKERGHITDPINSDAGWLILRVEDQHKAGQAALEEVENEIREKLFMPRFQPRLREYLTQLRREAFLEIREGYVDTGAAPDKDTSWSDPAMLRPETVTKEEVANRHKRRRLLWMVPLPGTSTPDTSKSTSK